MKVVLELQDQPSNIRKVTVRHDIVIGRGAECNLRLSAPQVSRRHCFLRIGADGAFVSDLDSSNGTYLNGRKLSSGKRYPLDDNAVLAVGPVRFLARVQSEVSEDHVLKVQVSDSRIESESAVAAPPSVAGIASATISGMPEDSDNPAGVMNYAVEHAGASSEEDDVTADYVSTDGIGESDYFASNSDGVLKAASPSQPLESETIASVDVESDFVLELADEEDEVTVLEGGDAIVDDSSSDSNLNDFLKKLK